MPSESVWFEQVDTALIDYIQSVVKLEDSMGYLVPVPVSIRKPDEDFKIEAYPCITLYNLYSQRDEVRYFPGSVVVSRDYDASTLVTERGAIPYNLFYQIDFWSRYQTDMNEMTRKWLSYHPDRCFNLPVKDMSGKDRSSFVLMTDDLKKSDLLENSERLFHSMMTYRVWVELDDNIQTVKPMVSSIDLNTVREERRF